MKRARGKQVYILTAVLAVVIAVAWYFLLLDPTRDSISQKTQELETAQSSLNAAKQEVVRLESYKKSAPQSRAEIVRLGKMLPMSEGIPSLIVQLSKTASSSGVTLVGITRGQSTAGTPFGIQTVTLEVAGRFFDVQDFLHSLENYVAFHNEDFRVTGRLLQVESIKMAGATTSANGSSSAASPTLTVTIVLNAYLWGGAAGTAAATTGGAT